MNHLSRDDFLLLYKSIFVDECQAIIKSKEYTELQAGLSNEERKIIKRNQEQIADYASRYYLKHFGSNLNEEQSIKRAVNISLKRAINNFR